MTTSTTATALRTPAPRRRRRLAPPRPRKTDRRVCYFFPEEGRRINAWARRNGYTTDNEALRAIILERLDADQVADPGERSPLGLPVTSPWRPPAARTEPTSDAPQQLAIGA